MTGRTLAITLAAWGCGLAAPCLAQGYDSPGEVVTLPAEAGGFSYSSGAFGDGGGYAGTAPAGYSGVPANCPPAGAYGPAVCEPRPACWWKLRPLFLSPRLLKPPRNAFVRVEYLLWEIEEPGSVLLGAQPPILREDLLELTDDFFFQTDFDETADPLNPDTIFDDDFDPQNGFFTFDPTEGFEFSYTPRLDEIQLRDNSGIRATLGIPTYEYGTIELSGWMLQQASDHYSFGPLAFIPPFYNFINLDTDIEPETGVVDPGTTFDPTNLVRIDGASAGSFGGFFTGFFGQSFDRLDVIYKSDLIGADAEFVVDALAPEGEGLKFKPLFGFKYVGLQEAFYQRGLTLDPVSPFSSSVNADTSNTILGGTIGLRTELEHRWFIVGVQPSVTFAGNISQVRVATDRYTGVDDPYREVESDYFDFSPVLDLNAYARICLSENLRLTVGYDAFWLAHVYRPARVIDYSVVSDGTVSSGFRSDFDTKREDDHVAVEGLSVGLEFVF